MVVKDAFNVVRRFRFGVGGFLARIAVVGSGISGLSCAYALNSAHDVTVIEAADRLGGHAHTQSAMVNGQEIEVDTGFIVYNERNYPDIIRFFSELDIETIESDMSFGASVDDGRLEYCGSSASALLAQPSNVLKPRFVRMLSDILRFNRLGTVALDDDLATELTLGEFLERHRFSNYFRQCYLLPMGAAIWSMPIKDMMAFPAATFLRFFHNHGLLTVNDHPIWRTLRQRSAGYVGKVAAALARAPIIGDAVAQIELGRSAKIVRLTSGRTIDCDHVVLAGHADQSLAVLAPNFAVQRQFLRHFRFQPNDAVLHSDPKLMPKRRRAWASWNYFSNAIDESEPRVSLTYWMNKLQSIDPNCPLFVTLNPTRQPDEKFVHNRMVYEHPVFDAAAIKAQGQLDRVQGRDGIWLAGAWLGYGFHEDGARSGFDVAAALGAPVRWQSERRARAWQRAEPVAA